MYQSKDNLMKYVDKPELSEKIQGYMSEIDKNGCIIIPNVLSPNEVEDIKEALAPYWTGNKGRTDFEGFERK